MHVFISAPHVNFDFAPRLRDDTVQMSSLPSKA